MRSRGRTTTATYVTPEAIAAAAPAGGRAEARSEPATDGMPSSVGVVPAIQGLCGFRIGR